MSALPREGISEARLAPARSRWLRLLPLALMLLAVAAMVVGGIARNRARVRGAGAQHGAARMDVYCNSAAGFLGNSQREDGSWPGARSRSREFKTPEPADAVAATQRVLLGLRRSGVDAKATLPRGLDFVREAQQAPGLWIDLETTAMGWLLLRESLSPSPALELFLSARETPSGLYLDHAAMEDVRPPALHTNLLLLGVLRDMGRNPAPLEGALRRALGAAHAPSETAWPVLAYVANESAAAGSTAAASILESVLIPGLAETAAQPATALDTVSLASFVALRATQCVRRAERCPDTNLPLATLLGRMNAEGAFAAAPFARVRAQADGGVQYVGSSAETTAVSLQALTAYRALLRARAAPADQSRRK